MPSSGVHAVVVARRLDTTLDGEKAGHGVRTLNDMPVGYEECLALIRLKQEPCADLCFRLNPDGNTKELLGQVISDN